MDLKKLIKARLISEENMTFASHYEIASGIVAVTSSRSPDKEAVNEDSAALIPVNETACVLVVADGAGGLRGGSKASSIAINSLKESIDEVGQKGISLREAILDGFEKASANIAALGLGAATTMAVVEIAENTARPYHVGDSLILITGQKGRIKWQSISHSPVGYAIEAGVINEADAMHHKDRHLVSNFLGLSEMRIEIGPTLPLAERDTILIASDGLSDNIGIDEIVENVRHRPLPKVMKNIQSLCQARMQAVDETKPSKPDDLTFITFRLKA